ncbi:MAG: hypothetical protein IKT33_03425 [Clostridia bacterium]|nr:hypothetical protein [Clostridia bacterium]
MAHCEFCDKETDNDNLEEVGGAIVRVCDDCRNNPTFGGELYARKIENESNKPVEQPKPLEHYSFNPNVNRFERWNQIKKNHETTALVDEQKLLKVTRELARLKTEEAAFKAELQQLMERNGTKSLKTKYFTITYVEEHSQRKLDTKALEETHPDLCAEFMKTSTVKASVKITLKKEKKGEKENA